MSTHTFDHRDLTSDTFAAALAAGANFAEVFVIYDGVGTARAQRVRAESSSAPTTYNVSLDGTVLATGRSTLTLAELTSIVAPGFTDPPTVEERLTSLESRVTALENA